MAKRVPWARGNGIKNGRAEIEFSLLLARHGDFRRNPVCPPEPRSFQRFADFYAFVVKTLQSALTEYENITAGSFIFRTESGSIEANASNPVVFVVYAIQTFRSAEQVFDDA